MNNKLGLTHTITFGKYKGKTIEHVILQDPSYIDWCLDNITSFKLTNKAQELLDNTEEDTIDPELEEIYRDFQYGRNDD